MQIKIDDDCNFWNCKIKGSKAQIKIVQAMKTKPEQSLACVWCWCFLPAQPLLILEECVSASPRGQSRYHLHRYPFVTGIEPSLLAPPRLMHSLPMFATFHYTVHRETRFGKGWLSSLVGSSFVYSVRQNSPGLVVPRPAGHFTHPTPTHQRNTP